MDLTDDSVGDEECCQILVNELHQLGRELEIPSPKRFGIDEAFYEGGK